MRSDVVLILSHIYQKQLAYKSGVMTSRGSKINEVPLAEHLAEKTVEDFKADAPSSKFDKLVKSVLASCKALDHSPQAAKFAQRNCSAFVDHFGLNNLFLTISLCDTCLLKVQRFANSNKYVSTEVRPCCRKK
jgi:hypothetical protein